MIKILEKEFGDGAEEEGSSAEEGLPKELEEALENNKGFSTQEIEDFPKDILDAIYKAKGIDPPPNDSSKMFMSSLKKAQ